MTKAANWGLGLAAIAALGACAYRAGDTGGRTPANQARFDKMLAGKVAGTPMRCLPSVAAHGMQVIDDRTIVYESGRMAYVNNLRGECSGIGSVGAVFVTESVGNSDLCDGDRARVVDSQVGAIRGFCAFGPFIPYAPAR